MNAPFREVLRRPLGCAAFVTLVLLYGSVGDGVLTTPEQPAIFVPGFTSVVSLIPGIQLAGLGWLGAPPPAGGLALMVWTGPTELPVELAAGTLTFHAAAIYRYNSAERRFDVYVAGGPAFVQTYTTVRSGDVVVVVRAE